jgi:hypothetical protein
MHEAFRLLGAGRARGDVGISRECKSSHDEGCAKQAKDEANAG